MASNSARDRIDAIRKKPSSTTTNSRLSKRQVSSAQIHTVSRIVNLLKPLELMGATRFHTYQCMLQDDAVRSAMEDRITAVEMAQTNGKFKYNNNSENSKTIKEYLEYVMDNMQGQTPRSVARAAIEMIPNGYAPFEKVFTKVSGGDYDGMFTLKNLAYIHPLTLSSTEPFTIAEDQNKILTINQCAKTLVHTTTGRWLGSGYEWSGIKKINYRRIASCAYSSTTTQPFGNSLFDAIYTAWREKQLLQDYLLVGVGRDLSGTPVLKVPAQIIEKAEKDPTSWEAHQLTNLNNALEDMHSGDATSMILPSDSHGTSTSPQYDAKFLGVEGGGKNFDIVEIIEQKKKAIYNVLSAQHLITGESGGGSFNLREGQMTTQAMAVGRDCEIIDEMWNKQIFPQLLELNGIEYEPEDLPVWESGEVQPLSTEEFSKGIMRCKSLLPVTPVVINQILKGCGVDYEVDESMTTEELRKILPDFEDNTGESGGSSGTGDTQSGGKSSDTNGENKG